MAHVATAQAIDYIDITEKCLLTIQTRITIDNINVTYKTYTMEEIFDNKIGRIETEMTSIYSKEDVIKIITELQLNTHYYLIKNIQQPTEKLNILASDFANFTSSVREKLSYYLESSDIVDYDSAQFEIEYNNQIVLNHVQVDLDSWSEEFDTYMLDNFTRIFGDDSIIEE